MTLTEDNEREMKKRGMFLTTFFTQIMETFCFNLKSKIGLLPKTLNKERNVWLLYVFISIRFVKSATYVNDVWNVLMVIRQYIKLSTFYNQVHGILQLFIKIVFGVFTKTWLWLFFMQRCVLIFFNRSPQKFIFIVYNLQFDQLSPIVWECEM